MSVTKALLIMVVLVLLGTGCSLVSQWTNSPQYQRFCEWNVLAVTAIEASAVEALKDPKKQKVGQALSEAANYLRAAAQVCPKPSA